jgi:enolase-phosphatase E1
MNFKAILLDIEGTTTPIDFVHKTLFPFARKRMREFVAANFGNLQDEIVSLHAEHAKDLARGESPPPFDETSVESITAYLHFLIDRDRKNTALKNIQGKIWQKGYESGELRGEVFADVLPAFERWTRAGKKIAIFSSGSRLAQKLIFGFSTAGDLTKHISAYFDTTTGAKREAESYRKIAVRLNVEPSEVLFLSDTAAELEAAAHAGMKCRLLVRPNNALPENPTAFESLQNFDEI